LAIEPYDAPAGRARRLVSLVARLAVVCLVRFRYGTVVYLGPDTLLRGGHDRRWFTRSGVRTVTVFLGSEARPPYLDGAFAHGSAPEQLKAVRTLTLVNRARVQKAERDSSYVVNHPGTAQFHEQPFVDWTVLGYPSPDMAVATRSPSTRGSDRPIVLHAPSDPRMKGTDRVREAVAGLLKAGADFDYVEMSGRPHAEVLDAVRNADLVVDQLYSDLVLPGLACEAVRLGTPVLVFGDAGELLGPLARRAGTPMSHYAAPSSLVDVLRSAVTRPVVRAALRSDQLAYVSGAGSQDAVAQRWARVVRGDVPDAWLDDPLDFAYVQGCAISQDRLQPFLRAYLTAYGPAGLDLAHHPVAQAAIVRHAAWDSAQRQPDA